jgi:hypothetical protein
VDQKSKEQAAERGFHTHPLEWAEPYFTSS